MAYLTSEPPQRSSKNTILLVAILIVLVGILAFVALRKEESAEVTYYKSVMSAEKIEYEVPTRFLEPGGTYRKTLFGPKYRVEGSVTNNATKAVYKDVIVEISFYSKTKTQIGSTNITIYEVFPPKAVKNFDVKVAAPAGTETIGWEVVGAAKN